MDEIDEIIQRVRSCPIMPKGERFGVTPTVDGVFIGIDDLNKLIAAIPGKEDK